MKQPSQNKKREGINKKKRTQPHVFEGPMRCSSQKKAARTGKTARGEKVSAGGDTLGEKKRVRGQEKQKEGVECRLVKEVKKRGKIKLGQKNGEVDSHGRE